MTDAIPRALSTDEQWAEAIRWLQAMGLVLYVPIRGKIWFEKPKDRERK